MRSASAMIAAKANRGATSPSGSTPASRIAASCERARLTRLLMVPMAQPVISAAFLVGEAGGADQDQRLALLLAQGHHRAAQVRQVH